MHNCKADLAAWTRSQPADEQSSRSRFEWITENCVLNIKT